MTAPGSLADATRSVLLAVRLRAVAEPEALQASLASLGLAVDDLDGLVHLLERAGLLDHRDGGFPGWRLTADGRHEGERLLAQELDGLGVRAEVTRAYETFLASNGVLLRICTDWQLVDANPSSLVVNDHADPDYDAAVIGRLRTLHDRVLPICSTLTAHLPRFAAYGPRFTVALDRITSGDREAFDNAGTDSYHAIWFELHDHLLATLGRDRSTEPLPEAATDPGPPPGPGGHDH